MIERLIIENFRSIKSADVNFGKLNAIIGPNNSGKSNILRALNLLLGDRYTTADRFDDNDFYNHDKRNAIKMQVIFTKPLQSNSKVWGFSISFDGNECEYGPLNEALEVIDYGYGPAKVKNEMKDEVRLMFLGVNRLASQQVRTSQWLSLIHI